MENLSAIQDLSHSAGYFAHIDNWLKVIVYRCIHLPLQNINIWMSVQWLNIFEKGSVELLTLKFSKIYKSPGLIEHWNALQQKAAIYSAAATRVTPAHVQCICSIYLNSLHEEEKALLTINSHLRVPASRAVEHSHVSSQTGLYVFGQMKYLFSNCNSHF